MRRGSANPSKSPVTAPLRGDLVATGHKWSNRFMNVDALVLALVAIADLALIAHLRQRRDYRVRQDRMMGSLRLALYWANREQRKLRAEPTLPDDPWETQLVTATGPCKALLHYHRVS